MKRFKTVYTVLAVKFYDDPRFDIREPDIIMEDFERLEDALEKAKLLEEEGWKVRVFKSFKA